MSLQDSHAQAVVSPSVGTAGGGDGHPEPVGGGRPAPLRVDAQRNLEHVLRAAREVFGELGYGAPMEDVARRARVGVGTVYRRFPSKDVLVRRIAEEETARLTEQARTALGQEEEPWSALSRFLRTSVASGAGRLLPPHVLRVHVAGPAAEAASGPVAGPAADREASAAGVAPAGDAGGTAGETGAPVLVAVEPLSGTPAGPDGGAGETGSGGAGTGGGAVGAYTLIDEIRVPHQRGSSVPGPQPVAPRPAPEDEPGGSADPGVAELLEVVGRLVERAREAGELRLDVTVADVLLVIATAAPALPDPAQQSAVSDRLLHILLEGLRPHGA
ncbi:TetR family transcriptional regulator [Streptomyces sp. LP05-1]|uniref:TetR family transcriptional regulator n=1 Tax=Streptomyces pyxinae TaxID=2970734 RepID=A0ABT2CNA5_9ACTN|nr:TetR family transcriptional regulator [Streptomyces sp. LP05-1]MCS0638902.1 TetR family transcriptional regulator [Streptomyces sp. LP05-1]